MQIYTLQLSAGMRYCFLGGQHISMGSALFKFPETFSLYKNDIKRHHKSVFSNMAAFFRPQVYSYYNNPRKQDIMVNNISYLREHYYSGNKVHHMWELLYTVICVIYSLYNETCYFFFRVRETAPCWSLERMHAHRFLFSEKETFLLL